LRSRDSGVDQLPGLGSVRAASLKGRLALGASRAIVFNASRQECLDEGSDGKLASRETLRSSSSAKPVETRPKKHAPRNTPEKHCARNTAGACCARPSVRRVLLQPSIFTPDTLL
jgi:hypothetical protein